MRYLYESANAAETHALPWLMSGSPHGVWLTILLTGYMLLAVPAVGHGQASRVTGKPSCANCSIEVGEPIEFAGQSWPAGIKGLPRVVATMDGGYLVSADLQPLPFAWSVDGSGSYRGPFPRDEGMIADSRVVRHLAVSGRGDVFTFDLTSGTRVYDRSGRYMRWLNAIPKSRVNPVILADTMIAIIGMARPRAYPDRPVQIYHAADGRLLAGTGPVSDLDPGAQAVIPSIAASSSGALWAVEAPGTVTRWSSEGDLLAELVWADEWPVFADAQLSEGSYDPSYVLHDVWEDSDGELLWVLSALRTGNRNSTGDPGEMAGRIPTEELEPRYLNEAISTVVSAVDLTTREVVAHRVLEVAVYEFLEDGRIVTMESTTGGGHVVNIRAVRLRRGNREGG